MNKTFKRGEHCRRYMAVCRLFRNGRKRIRSLENTFRFQQNKFSCKSETSHNYYPLELYPLCHYSLKMFRSSSLSNRKAGID